MHNDPRFALILAQHQKQQTQLLQDIALTEQEIQNNKQRLDKLRQIKIHHDASITDLLAISDLLDTI
jgi:DNA repair ATPase RecN